MTSTYIYGRNETQRTQAPEVYRVVEVRNFKTLFHKHDEDGGGSLDIGELDPLIREIGYIPSQALRRPKPLPNDGSVFGNELSKC